MSTVATIASRAISPIHAPMRSLEDAYSSSTTCAPFVSGMPRDLATALRRNWNVDFDDAGAIGRRYRRQDEIGTPFCVTVDFDTLTDLAVTVRERDTMSQERVAMDQLEAYLAARLIGC